MTAIGCFAQAMAQRLDESLLCAGTGERQRHAHRAVSAWHRCARLFLRKPHEAGTYCRLDRCMDGTGLGTIGLFALTWKTCAGDDFR